MPHDRFEWHGRIKGVEREYRATYLALGRLADDARLDPGVLHVATGASTLSLSDAIQNVEGTYLVRMFAEFENALRSFWRTIRDTIPMTRDLMDGVASRRRIPHDSIERAHLVRGYRNHLVHESEAVTERVAIEAASRHLNTYLGRLPERWG